jgi:hypothetical protein
MTHQINKVSDNMLRTCVIQRQIISINLTKFNDIDVDFDSADVASKCCFLIPSYHIQYIHTRINYLSQMRRHGTMASCS